MSSSKVGDSLSLRLSKIRSFYQNEFYLWDIGCDHGDLGLSFVNSPSVEVINLVDPSISVKKSLELKLKDSYITKPLIEIKNERGQDLKITNDKKNLIFIAGMGGKEIGEIIYSLLPQLDSSSKIVISPHKNILELRSFLNSLPLCLEEETLVFENHQFYQIMVLKPDSSFDRKRVSVFGEEIWKSPLGISYRSHLLKHLPFHRGKLSQDFLKYLNSLLF